MMDVLKEFVTDILEQRNGFRLGEPWRYSGKSAGVIVPILRDISEERDYVTLPEVKDKIEIIDTGSIGKVKVKGIDKPLFIRAGSMLEGKGTQSRAVEHNVILEAEVVTEIPVKCIHQSKAIVSSAKFRYQGLAPRLVVHKLVSSTQFDTWNSIRCYASTAMSQWSDRFTVVPHTTRIVTDNLVEIKKAIRKLDNKMKEILEKVPALENQVGAIIISVNGIEGIEVFDHPESWKAHYKDVIENYECLKEELPPLFKLDEDAVFEHIKNFMNKLKDANIEKVNSNSYIIKFDGFIGEYTVFNNRIIHLFVVKSDSKMNENEESNRRLEDIVERLSNYWERVTSTTSADSSYRFDEVSVRAETLWKNYIDSRKGFRDLLEELKNGLKTWSELEKSTSVSKSTLSARIRNGLRLGLIEKEYKDGKKYYKLTDKGKEIVRYLF